MSKALKMVKTELCTLGYPIQPFKYPRYLTKVTIVHPLNTSHLQSVEMTVCTVKPVLSGHSKRRPKIVFLDRLSLNAGQKFFRPSLSYHLSLRSLFCLFLSGRLRQVLLYLYLKLILKYQESSEGCFRHMGDL